MRERPRLASEVTQVTYFDPDLFPYLPVDGLLQCLAGLDEAGQAGVHRSRKPGVAGQQGSPVGPLHEHYHRWGQARISDQPTPRAAAGSFGWHRLCRLSATPAELMGAVPGHYLHRPAGDGPDLFLHLAPQLPQVNKTVVAFGWLLEGGAG